MTKVKTSLIWSIALGLLLSACGGLSSEPEIAREIALPTVAPTVAAALAAVPDMGRGAAFYAEHCAMCHGAAGQGDGEMVRDGRLSNAPPDFTDPATTLDRTPAEYLRAVTEGNVLAGMPPFASYTEQERWDAVAYVYGGGVSADRLALGQALYEANCVACHGAQGRGDGPDAPAIMPDLSSLSAWAETSNAALSAAISQGIMPGMPAFAGELGESEIQAVAAYVRTLAVPHRAGFDSPVVAAEITVPDSTEVAGVAAATPAAAAALEATETIAEPETISVRGVVTNGTAGGAIPADLVVTLHMFDPPDYVESTLEATINADGTFTFGQVPHLPDRAYLLSLQYQGVFFSSTVYTLADPAVPSIDAGIEIFDITNDASVVTVDAGLMRVTFGDLGMEVVQVISITNSSDRLFLTDERLNENQRVALSFPLPPGAGGVGFEPGMQDRRFVVSEDGTAVIDTQPLRPGSEDIFMSYFIPYSDGAIIEQVFNYPYRGPFHLLIETGKVTVDPGIFEGTAEPVDMGGQVFDTYVAQIDQPAGDVLSFTLSGEVQTAPQAGATAQEGGLSPVVIILIVAGLVLLGVGGFMFLLRQDPGAKTRRQIDDLLERIAELDDQHDQGMLNHDYYQRTRAALKAELAELMREQDDQHGEGA